MELDQSREREILKTKVTELKNLQLDTFKEGNFVDILDEHKNWCVGQITGRTGDMVNVHYEGCPTKYDETVSVKRTTKIASFRKFTRGYTGLKKSAARNYTFNLEDLKEVEGFIKYFTEDKFQSIQDAREILQTLRGKIFFYMDIFMTTPYSPKDQPTVIPLVIGLILDFINLAVEYFNFYQRNIYIVNEFLVKNKDLAQVHYKCAILSALPEILVTLKRIFGEDSRVSEFYKTYEDQIKKHLKSINFNAGVKTKICIDKAYKNGTDYNSKPAVIIAQLIDYFNDKNGFQLLWDIVLSTDNKSNPTPPFEVLDQIIQHLSLYKVIIDMKTHFSNQLSQLRYYIYSRINGLTEAEIKEVKKFTLINCLKNSTILLPVDQKTQKIMFEELYLTYYYKCLVSKNLEKRIAGITAVNLIIDTLDRKESSTLSITNGKVELDDFIEILDTKSLLAFFKEKNFIDVLLGESIHEEIIKRALPFFKLLAKKNSPIICLSAQVYDLMWKNYLEKHESIAIQIETIICELSCFIPDKDKQYIFNKIKSLTTSQNFSTKTITFVKNFTENCLRKTTMSFSILKQVDFFTDERMFGLPLLWNYLLDCGGNVNSSVSNGLNILNSSNSQNVNLSPNSMMTDSLMAQKTLQNIELTEVCVDSLNQLMMMNSLDDLIKEKVISLCFENISNSHSVVQSINLMRKMILEFPNMKSKRVTKKMDEMFGLMNLIIADLERYLKKVRENSTLGNSTASLSTVYEGYYNHKINIETRLELVIFFCNAHRERGRVNLTTDQTERIFTTLICDPSSTEMEKNILFEVFRKNAEEFNDDIVEFILCKLICDNSKMNFAEMSMVAYNCFEKFFNHSNYNKSKFSWDGRNYRVGSDEVVALEVVFQMLCEVRQDNVRNKISRLLASVCTDLKVFSEEFSAKHWKKFIDKMFLMLNESYASKNENGIKGIMSLIRLLIKEIGNVGEIPINDDVSFPRDGVECKFICPDKSESRSIKVGFSELTCDVRCRVAYFFDIPINALSLKTKQRTIDMSDDFKQFKELCNISSSIEVKETPHPILSLKNNPKALLMSNSKLVKIIYELLHNFEATYIQDVWELINVLPKNGELEEEIGNLGKEENSSIDWDKYFDSHSIYIISYSLKLVKNLIFTIEYGNDGKLSKCFLNKDWITIFGKNRGIKYILQLLFEFKIDYFNSELGFECLNDLLFLLKNMLPDQMDSNLPDERSIVKKIIELIFMIVQSSYLRDSDKRLNELQEVYRRRREKDLFRYQDEDDNAYGENSEEYCEEVLKFWNSEDDSIRNLIIFLDDFKMKQFIFDVLLNEEKPNLLNEIVTFGFICPKNYKFKKSLHKFINNLLAETEKMRKFFKTALFDRILSIETFNMASEHSNSSRDFFKIVAALLENHIEFSNGMQVDFELGNANVDFFALAEHMIDYIAQFKEEEENDAVLEGYLNILRVLILKSREVAEFVMKKHNLIDLILNKCLMAKCQPNSTFAPFPKCKASEARSNAYKLLTAISYNHPDTMKKIISKLNETHALGYWKSKKLLDWRISLQHDEKSSTGYVGLKNLGCTCYMNSLIQQFFMIPQLRESLLAAPDKHTGKVEESALYQLKNIFASLKAFEGQYYNAKDFCFNLDGQPLDIREQMDVDEFFNLLIDKIENHIKDSEFQNIFKHFFGFTISDGCICKGCPHFSERNVYSQAIQLQVQNKKSIIDSLKSYVEGELLEGDNAYHCEKCDKKVNALKRQCVKRLPKTLMVVMKRFEFDFENMVKIKVNDYCEFPFELDMEPYTQEYLQRMEKKDDGEDNNTQREYQSTTNNDEVMTEASCSEKFEGRTNTETKPSNYYKYNLTGVIIHTGTSESGHYYSIIKDYDKDAWYEFNDTNIKPYDINDLPNEAFGGTETVYNRDNKKEIVEKQTNAYLLFYTREYNEDNTSLIISDTDNNGVNSNQPSKVITDYSKFSNITPTILDRIHTDNLQYWICKILFSTEYHAFITDLLVNSNTNDHIIKNYLTKNDNAEVFPDLNLRLVNGSKKVSNNCNVDASMIVNTSNQNDYVMIINKDDELFLFQFACSFLFNVLLRAREKQYQPAMVDVIKAMVNKEVLHAEWLLEEFSNFEIINEYLVECPMVEMRKLVVGILYACLIKCYKSRPSSYQLDKNCKLVKFINNVMMFMMKFKDLQEKDLTYVYYVLYRFCLLGEGSRLYLIDRGILHYLTYSYLSKTESLSKELLANESVKVEVYAPSHMELNKKLMNKVDRLSAFEELVEKKHAEKIAQNKSDCYLLMTFCELVRTCNLNISSSIKNNISLFTPDPSLSKCLVFTNYHFVKILLLEAKTKPAAISLSKMVAFLCYNNLDHSDIFLQVIMDCINTMDAYELEYIMKVFKNFLLKFEDPLKESRITTALKKYFQTVLDNLKYWGFVDYNIDFIIKLFNTHFDMLKTYIDPIRDSVVKLIKYLKDNPCPPTLIPSRTVTMHKKRQVVFPKNVHQVQVNNFMQRHTNNSNEKMNKLKEIYNKQVCRTSGFDSDIDLTDFKFSIKDRVKFDNFNATVINVLDEMINIEYDKNEISGTKRPPTQWVDTDNKNLLLVELYDDSDVMMMQVEK